MHFFRALWAEELVSAGFKVKKYSSKSLTYRKLESLSAQLKDEIYSNRYLSYKDIVIQEDCQISDSLDSCKKFLSYPETLQILYNKSLSNVIFLIPKVRFNKNGRVDLGIKWEGEMVRNRIGDTLPFEYILKK